MSSKALQRKKNAEYYKAWYHRNKDTEKYKSKNRDKHRFRKYGLSREDFEGLLNNQNNKCASCSTDLLLLPDGHVHIDHCHKTNRVRSVLCLNCNVALGHMNDDPDRLRLLISYITKQNLN